jgi:hypothetical protein
MFLAFAYFAESGSDISATDFNIGLKKTRV